MSSKPRLSSLTFVGFGVNAALDHGKGSEVSFEEVYEWLERGTLLQELDKKLHNTFDFSMFPPGSDEEKAIVASLKLASEGFLGRERKMTGVEKSGLALLMACVLEAIQQLDKA